MTSFEIRAPRPDDLLGLARLKVEWARLEKAPDADAVEDYAADLAAWLERMGDRVVCRIAVDGAEPIGMTWLTVFDRVPDFADRARRTGDVQSMYVVPAFRSRGIGRALLESLCAGADARGIPRVTVSSSAAGVHLYEAAGFRSGPLLLARTRPRPAE